MKKLFILTMIGLTSFAANAAEYNHFPNSDVSKVAIVEHLKENRLVCFENVTLSPIAANVKNDVKIHGFADNIILSAGDLNINTANTQPLFRTSSILVSTSCGISLDDVNSGEEFMAIDRQHKNILGCEKSEVTLITTSSDNKTITRIESTQTLRIRKTVNTGDLVRPKYENVMVTVKQSTFRCGQ